MVIQIQNVSFDQIGGGGILRVPWEGKTGFRNVRIVEIQSSISGYGSMHILIEITDQQYCFACSNCIGRRKWTISGIIPGCK